jgi:beta-mannosidase
MLTFEGLDTHASVYLNDELILEAHNQFRAYDVNFTQFGSLLKQKDNKLTIKFRSSVDYDNE